MSRRGLALVVSLQFAALLVVCLLVGDSGWDDGAITLAFSRTFADVGRIALTPRSEVVEGFSSVSWFLLNAAAALGRPSYGAAIFVSQALAAAFVCASTALLARTCALLGLGRLPATLTVITFAAWGGAFTEASNGMEMGLAAAAFLVVLNELLAPRPRLPLLAAGVAAAVATRFEAALPLALLALAVAPAPGRRAFLGVAGAALGAIALLTAWRLAVFADFLPNTFWAKRWPPYAVPGLVARLRGAAELPGLFVAPLAALAALAAARRRAGLALARAPGAGARALPILAAPVVGAVVIGALVGKPWGHFGRMPYFAVAPALLLIALALEACLRAAPGPRRLAAAAAPFALAFGASLLGFPWGALAAARAGGAFGVTPHTYAASGRTFRRVAAAAEVPHPTILTPDVGGLALADPDFRIVDLAMLSNRRLAHDGPGALAEVLDAESPALIEAHWRWASATGLYDLPAFRDRYAPAFVDGTRLWLRRDLARALEIGGRGCRLAAGRADVREALDRHRYADHDLPEDRSAFARAGAILALDQRDCEPAGAAAGK